MRTMKIILILSCLALLVYACRKAPAIWKGTELTQPRAQLTVAQLLEESTFPLIDMSFFARPEWAQPATRHFSGAISFEDTELIFPIERAYYPGENIFPGITLDFICDGEELIPIRNEIWVNGLPTNSAWNVIVGAGKVWYEAEDGAWCRASFPLSLTDSYIGQVRNCVATFVYKQDSISNVCVQCSQETADLNDHQVGNIRVMLPAEYQPRTYADSLSVIEKRNRLKSRRLPVYPLSLGAEDFTLLRTMEADGSVGLPILAYGAWPTLDEAAKIAWLFSKEGNHNGRQLLHRKNAVKRSATPHGPATALVMIIGVSTIGILFGQRMSVQTGAM